MKNDLFEDVELASPSNTETGIVDVIQDDRPKTTDPEWNDYVLSLFDDSEMYDGRPLCHGEAGGRIAIWRYHLQ